jgi:hypothetical protein
MFKVVDAAHNVFSGILKLRSILAEAVASVK